MGETIKLDVASWKIKQVERGRGRMKFQIKLNKMETESFKVFTETVKPEEVSQDDFVKSIFLTGIESMNQKIMSMVEEYAKENPEQVKSIIGRFVKGKIAPAATEEASLPGL